MISQNAGKSFESALDVQTIYDTDDGTTVVDKNSKTTPMGARSVLKIDTEIDKPTVFDSADESVPAEEAQTKYDGGSVEVPPVLPKRVPTIKRILTGEQVKITGNVFRIGRKDDGMDYVVSHNPAISKKHAEVLVRDGKYYVRDVGSKNGTYVNGRILPKNKEVEISNGDLIKLANEDFLVQI